MRQSVRIKKLRPGAVVPTYASPLSAGADLYACADEAISIGPGETAMIMTGLALEIPEGHTGLVCARSGLATKKGLAPANKVGVIDSDYRGELMVSLFNHGNEAQTVLPGERIAQLVVVPVVMCDFVLSEELGETARGAGGFGSTGQI